MLLNLYGSIRRRFLNRKDLLLGIVTILFFAFYIYSRVAGAEKYSDYAEEPPDYRPAYYANVKNLGIGMVGVISAYEDTNRPMPVVPELPIPKAVDDEGKEVSLRFLIVADWGGQSEPPYTTVVQRNLAYALGEFARRYEARFVLSLGDNFCDEGVKDVDDTRFQDTFENVFTAPALRRPWYFIAGNDDYKGNVSAQIEYTKKSRRWFFEKEYYKLSFELPSFRNMTVDILMIDTVQLCGPIAPGQHQPIEPEYPDKAEKQWKWIEKNLKMSSASYLLVAGHYPVVSGGSHGSTTCLKRRLKPLLEANHVTAYFSGHDHSAQHYRGLDTKGISYFITGATHPREDKPHHLDGLIESSQFFWTATMDKTAGAFTYCDIRKDFMSVAFINTDQKALYFTTVSPRSNKSKRKKFYLRVVIQTKPI